MHLGIQTLRGPLRRLLGRRLSPERILDRIERAVSANMVVSVDLLCGLPQQTPHDLCADIRDLAASGIHGFSLYHVNRRSAKAHAVSPPALQP